jgi:hypothetical protein
MRNQTTSQLMMVRPASFQFNIETAASNAFQKLLENLSSEEIKQKAIDEFDAYVAKLRQYGIDVLVIQDTSDPPKPDAIFPNNWISMQANGIVYLYPMCTPNRRLEKRTEIVDELKSKFEINEIIDLSDYEKSNQFLEGTGSIIFDHVFKKAYACLSPRTEIDVFLAHCKQLDYEPISFYSEDENGYLVYHTNVMLTIGNGFVVICLSSIKNKVDRKKLEDNFAETNHEIIDISFEQMSAFAGNMLQVKNTNGSTFLVMSQTALNSLVQHQIQQIKKYTEIISVEIPTIETIGGGSARCMLAEIYLEKM